MFILIYMKRKKKRLTTNLYTHFICTLSRNNNNNNVEMIINIKNRIENIKRIEKKKKKNIIIVLYNFPLLRK